MEIKEAISILKAVKAWNSGSGEIERDSGFYFGVPKDKAHKAIGRAIELMETQKIWDSIIERGDNKKYDEQPIKVTSIYSEEYRLRCLELASTLKPENGDKLTSQELLDLTDKLLNYIKRKDKVVIDDGDRTPTIIDIPVGSTIEIDGVRYFVDKYNLLKNEFTAKNVSKREDINLFDYKLNQIKRIK